MQIHAQGTPGILEFLHPDYVSAVAFYRDETVLNLFDGIDTMVDKLFVLFLVTISLIAIVVAYYYISNRRKK